MFDLPIGAAAQTPEEATKGFVNLDKITEAEKLSVNYITATTTSVTHTSNSLTYSHPWSSLPIRVSVNQKRCEPKDTRNMKKQRNMPPPRKQVHSPTTDSKKGKLV